MGEKRQTYRYTAEQLLQAMEGKICSEYHLQDPEGKHRLAGVKNVRFVSMLTGEYSCNRTHSKYGAAGTDLGFTANIGDKTYFFFGDTHVDSYIESYQKHNTIAWTTDNDYTDGITLDGWYTGEDGVFADFIPCGVSGLESEAATIPGGAFALDDTLYVSFMSVHHWTQSHWWPSNYGSFTKSTDGGKTWNRVPQLTWPGDSNFVQNAPQVVGDTVYVMGTGSGRDRPMSLMRVPKTQFECFDAYEYLTGYAPDGSPVFEKGEEAMRNALVLVEKSGEFSMMYSEYLQEWLMMHKVGKNVNYMRSAKEIWGPYSEALPLFENKEFWVPYGTIMNPRYTSEGGRKICFLMSMFWPVYNVGLFEVELIKKEYGEITAD